MGTPEGPERPAPRPDDSVVRDARRRDADADRRDVESHRVIDDIALNPDDYSPDHVAKLWAADLDAASADRASSAEDRSALSGGVTAVPPEVDLSPRELEVLERLGRGMTTRQIADDLYLGVNSVKTHTQTLYRKIGVTSRSQAAIWAKDHGIA